MNCAICGNINNNKAYPVKEMMQGTRHVFHYMECGSCGCVQLIDPPTDMSIYYRKGYYSLHQSPESLFTPAIKGWLKKHRDYYALTGKGIVGKLISSKMPSPNIELYHLRNLVLRKNFRMLDVGAGAGMLTYILFNAGFKGITGIDPYLDRDIEYKNGLIITRRTLQEITESNWDVIYFHHSFEHMADPKSVLNQVHQLLKPGGKCVIRIPTASSYAWRHYRENWVQLDAPRHYFLYTIDALKILALETNFLCKYLADESTSFQFLGSEQYKMDIPLHEDQRSYFEGNQSLFTSEQLAAFTTQAVQLNGKRLGDSINLLLEKI